MDNKVQHSKQAISGLKVAGSFNISAAEIPGEVQISGSRYFKMSKSHEV
jgi:hypothetical protein